jgi:uncharacterized protein (DUF1330 family)
MSVVSMYRRIRWPGWFELYRRKLPRPLVVLNLIDYRDREQYRWYGLFVVPAIYGVGGAVHWAGEWEASLLGERQGEALLLVQYPSQRRFLLMVTNPYYALINRFRENADAWFEASFTEARGDAALLRRQRLLLAAHCDDDAQAARVAGLLNAAGAEKVYAVRETAAFEIFREYRDSDPHPLRKKQALFFRPGPLADGLPEPLRQQLEAIPGLSLQLYRRQRRQDMLPQPLARVLNRRGSAA